MSEGQGYSEWPSTRWRLTAPESFVLLSGADASGSEAFKLGLMELVWRGSLVLDNQARAGRSPGPRAKRVPAMREGARPSPPAERSLSALWDLFQRAPRTAWINGESAVQVADLARTATRTYGSLKRYVQRDVLPPLVDRGLFVVQTRRVLLIFSTTRYVLTPDGEAARAELDRWLAAGRTHFARWVDSDLAQGFAYACGAGAALLLMAPLFPDLRQLREQTPLVGIDDDDGAGAFDFDFGNVATDVLSTFDSAMSAIDAAIDSAGGSSDSGGGGDPGGGGGDSAGGGGDSG